MSPRSLTRIVLIVLPMLAVAGCVAGILISADRGIDAERGEADPDHYRVEDLTCGTDEGIPVASVTITNTDDATRTFRVRLLMQDPDVSDGFAVRTERATLAPGASTSFDDVSLGWPFAGQPPAFIPPVCSVQVLNGR